MAHSMTVFVAEMYRNNEIQEHEYDGLIETYFTILIARQVEIGYLQDMYNDIISGSVFDQAFEMAEKIGLLTEDKSAHIQNRNPHDFALQKLDAMIWRHVYKKD